MFSIEKNYIKEQNSIIQDLQKELMSSKHEISSLKDKLQDLTLSKPNVTIDEKSTKDDNFMTLDDIFSEDGTDEIEKDIQEKEEEIVRLHINDLEMPLNIINAEMPIPKESINNPSPSLINIPATYEMYIPQSVIGNIQELNPDHFYRGKRKFVTLIKIIINDTNKLSKRLSPESYVKLYNKIFNQIFSTVYKHSGIINQYFGESLLVVFGLFDVDHPAHANKAINFIQELNIKIKSINEYLAEKSLDGIKLSCGVHSGAVIVGKIGSIKENNLLILGNEMRIVESLSYQSSYNDHLILLSEKTFELLEDNEMLQEMDSVIIHDSDEDLKVYRL